MGPADDSVRMLPNDERVTPRGLLHGELGRLIARLADADDADHRTDLADEAYDVISVLERLDGNPHVRHPRGLRVIDGGA
jgi:hypothetical protein